MATNLDDGDDVAERLAAARRGGDADIGRRVEWRVESRWLSSRREKQWEDGGLNCHREAMSISECETRSIVTHLRTTLRHPSHPSTVFCLAR